MDQALKNKSEDIFSSSAPATYFFRLSKHPHPAYSKPLD